MEESSNAESMIRMSNCSKTESFGVSKVMELSVVRKSDNGGKAISSFGMILPVGFGLTG
jgi:hypothetical protein